MRVAPYITFAAAVRLALAVTSAVALSGVASLVAADSAQAQQVTKKRTRIDVSKRSYLDAGTVVKPGSKSYLDYALPPGWFYPGYGQGGAAGPGPITGIRQPLPGPFELPGY
ncbi:hypothetical protein EZH22_08730 [Xanthobacter dioxanivorans]|uniref:Uncharacterized protein n=1 Tax=Xanthobacter dioxanivorans TaxID=2528964 RepID=A0A974PSA6_9HYPH|nr:hypothetical protein [Xanthobacter dioxanivorans]QRG08358.1 hypothetical protein EZH22_08730 [Xanthobacter dioxanivorans]